MNAETLAQFCSPERPALARPFSFGAYTYATRGSIVIRVPRRDDVAENPDVPGDQVVALFEQHISPAIRYKKVPPFELPEPPFEWEEKVDCFSCNGTGKQHSSCPDCLCRCRSCSGTGVVGFPRIASIRIGTLSYAAKYIALIAALPRLRLDRSRRSHSTQLLAFSFEDGEGLLMPLPSRQW
jgi:hypothetical protein